MWALFKPAFRKRNVRIRLLNEPDPPGLVDLSDEIMQQVASDRDVIKKIALIAYREMFDLLSMRRGQLTKMLPP